MELVFYLLVGISFLIAIVNWRNGLYAAVILDILRDPVRKLVEGHPVIITVSVAVVWLGIFLGALQQNRRQVFAVIRMFPGLRVSVQLLLVAMIPGAVLSLVLYAGGWRLALIGGASYLAPLLGFAIGFALAGDRRELCRFMAFYTALNSLAMLGTLAEYNRVDLPVLGGMDFEWIRHQPGVIIRLISGVYRSPDIMGLHAAHICMFSALLVVHRRSNSRWVWIGAAILGAVCLLLAGRRKMIGVPVVFLVSYYLLGVWLRVTRSSRFVPLMAAGTLMLGAVFMLTREAEISVEYADYATTLFTEGAQRSNELIVGSTLGTLFQSGVLGAGLGSATQGRQHVIKTTDRPRAWQEDGSSRLVMELGVFGALLVLLAVVGLLRAIIAALRRIPVHHSVQSLQIGIVAVVIGNFASFLISHQQYSGDPSTGMLVCVFMGFVLSCPLLIGFERSGVVRRKRRRDSREEPALGETIPRRQ